MSHSIGKFILENGLTVILKELHHVPAACIMIWYRVGSRNERAGNTGISHWVEHLMFSGTPTFPSGEFDRLISRDGGYWNAFTGLDHTAYYETVPADRLELCLHLEADRMINTNFTAVEVETERSIILSERAMYENDPRFQLSEELTSAAFRVHPYHHEVIGDEVDLRTITREDLCDYYRRHYVPNNAVIVVSGDFQSREMLSRITEHLGDMPAGALVTEVTRIEPPQRGERRVTVHGPGDMAYLTVAYRVPATTDPDYVALTLLNAAFAGGSSLGMFAGVGTNRSSRLYKSLVDAELAVGAGGGLAPTVDPFLYTINVAVRAGRSLEEVEAALDAELERLSSSPINWRELDMALKRARAQFIMAGESITGQAHLLGMAEATANDYHWYESSVEKLNEITQDDLERVRRTYLTKKNRTVGWYQPE
jgi:zinc protease